MKSVTGKGPNGGRNAAFHSHMVWNTLEACSDISPVRSSNVDFFAELLLFVNIPLILSLFDSVDMARL